MGKAHYLTARCPTGCETWLHPAALQGHLRPGQCRGHPWVDDIDDTALVMSPLADDLVALLPAKLVSRPQYSHQRLTQPRQGEYLHDDLRRAIAVRSPVAGVGARQWVHVARAARERLGDEGVRRALSTDGFNELQSTLIAPGDFIKCPDCHELVRRHAIDDHRAKSTVCRWRHAAAEVRELWADGWRDPWNIPGAPLKWGDLLAKVEWRRRVRTVEFPKWTAVLLSGAARHSGAPPSWAFRRGARR